MKEYLRRTIVWLLIIFSITGFVGYSQSSYFMINNTNSWRIQNFFREDKKSIDVVIIGASDVYTGFYPGVAYEKFGFTSYPLCVDGKTDALWTAQIREAIKEQDPKLILVDIGGALYEDEVRLFDDGIFRSFVDNTPLSVSKIMMLSETELKDDFTSYCFPLIKYRSDFSNAAEAHKQKVFFNDLKLSKLKGIGTITTIDKNQSSYEKTTEKIKLNKNSEKFLISFLDYCSKNKIKNVVFVRFPEKYVSAESLDIIRRCNTAKEIISGYGYDVIDFTDIFDQVGLDRENDFYNEEHMNVYGAVKFTEYLCRIISERYGIKPSELTVEQKENWNETVKYTNAFIKFSKELIEKGKEITLGEDKETYLMLEKEIGKD